MSTELSEPSNQTQDAQAPSEPSAGKAGSTRPRLQGALAIIALVLAFGATAAVGVFWQRYDTASREAARRLQQGEARAAKVEEQLRQTQERARDLESRNAVLENKLTDILAQQANLERMYQTITDEGMASVLLDVENAVAIASQQLTVSGNVRGAIVALQDADARLKRINQPQALGLRRLIARDLERLRAVPNVDVLSLVLRLDAISAGIDGLQLLSGLAAHQPTPSPSPTGPESVTTGGFSFEKLAADGWKGWRAITSEIWQLFRVNRVDAPDALLLAPEQQYFVRENLRLTLLSARLALLARAEPVFQADLKRAVEWLGTYYDRKQRPVATAMASLEQLAASRFGAELPSLGETLSAVRAAREPREAR